MNCRQMESKLADLLLADKLDPATVEAEAKEHLAACPACRTELAGLRATMHALDAWKAPEPSPFFDGKLRARLRAEREAAPAGFLERLRTRLLFGNAHLRPIAAGALAVVLAVGGGSTFWLEHNASSSHIQESATVRDLQSLDGNAQVFQQLSALDSDEDNGSSSSAN